MRKLHQPTEIAPKPRKQKNHKEPDETGSQIIMQADSSAGARLQPPSSYKVTFSKYLKKSGVLRGMRQHRIGLNRTTCMS